MWGVSALDDVYRFDAGTFQQVTAPHPDDLWATADGSVWGVSTSGDVYREASAGQTFSKVFSGVSYVVAGSQDQAWAVDAQTGHVWRWS